MTGRQIGTAFGITARASLLLCCFTSVAVAGGSPRVMPLPPRPPEALRGAAFAKNLDGLPLAEREEMIVSEVLNGNVPGFLRKFTPVESVQTIDGQTHRLRLWVAPDYLAVGSDDDYFLSPLTPASAQRIADALNCILPTPKMVDLVYAAAVIKLTPRPIPPGAAMTTVPFFRDHNSIIWTQRAEQLPAHPLGTLVAGHKKDVVLASALASRSDDVAIYGWHRATSSPIQPLYLGHSADWVDYSHGVRLVHKVAELGPTEVQVSAVLTNPNLAVLLSDEGPLKTTRYPFEPRKAETNVAPPSTTSYATGAAGDLFRWMRIEPGVRVLLDLGMPSRFQGNLADAPGKSLLAIYALPNGNTIEQTFGKLTTKPEEWRFNIQHIGAQTRYLRQALPHTELVVAYLEPETRSWPAWRKQQGDSRIPTIIQTLAEAAGRKELQIALNGHSGGGSFIFGYLNSVTEIPDQILRVAFLDSNYAYDSAMGHGRKLADWIKGGAGRTLCVLAYNDAIARLDGKPFVTAKGGTWGRSRAMLEDLREHFRFSTTTQEDLEIHSALGGRVQLLLHRNPEKRILHTVQVERNGFIHSMLAGSADESVGYEYFGEPVYRDLIRGDTPD